MNEGWNLFHGDNTIRRPDFPPAPPWRNPGSATEHRSKTYQPTRDEIRVVNVALHLRRPLLVEGPPGSGKSSLGFAVARELDLGPVLVWPINSRTTLRDGLYRYDAIGRMYALAPRMSGGPVPPVTIPQAGAIPAPSDDDRIGDFITLGALGTALLPSARPRVLVIDEIDKSDIDLPNDLLHVLEHGSFSIPELERVAKTKPEVAVLADPGEGADGPVGSHITHGRVQATSFPFVVITSNGERELPPAFLRRCVRYTMPEMDEGRLRDIVGAHLAGAAGDERVSGAIAEFFTRVQNGEMLAIDQLLNAAYLLTGDRRPPDAEWEAVANAILRDLQAP